MSAAFEDAVARIAQVVMFENWLRFYFISEEEDDTLVISLPEKAMEQLQKRYPTFYGLADRLNGLPIDHATSLNEVCLFVAGEFEGKALSGDMIRTVFDSNVFQVELQLFSAWVQSHEEMLDARFMEFGDWLERYGKWKETDEAGAYKEKVADQMTRFSNSATATPQ